MVRIRDHGQILHICPSHPLWTELMLGQLIRVVSALAEPRWLQP